MRWFYASINACSRAAFTPQNVHRTFLSAAITLHGTKEESLLGEISSRILNRRRGLVVLVTLVVLDRCACLGAMAPDWQSGKPPINFESELFEGKEDCGWWGVGTFVRAS